MTTKPLRLTRTSRRLFLSLPAILVAAACGGGGDDQTEGGVELTFRQFDPPGESEALVEAVEAWNAGHPDIQVELENIAADEVIPQYTREVQAGGGPDVQHLPFVGVEDLARNDLLADLSAYVDASPPGEGFDDFLATDIVTIDDQPYALPWTVDTFAMVYRPDILDAAGISTFPDTWRDLLSAAEQISAQGDQAGFCFPAGSAQTGGMWFLVNYYLWSNGNAFVEQTADSQYDIGATEEDVADTMHYFNSFFDLGATPESMVGVSSWGEPAYVGALGRGDCAISFMPPQTFREASGQSEEPLMTAAIPQGSQQRISHLGGRALGINPNSEHQDAAWRFVQFLTSAETFDEHGYNQYPAQEALLNEVDFPDEEQGFVTMLPNAVTFQRYLSSPASVPGMWSATNQEFAAVYSGQKSPEQASGDLIAAIEELLGD